MDFFDILLAKKLEDDRDPTIEGLSVTENGIYSEENKAYNPVIVEVPEPTLISKSITANGTYTASADNADGYSSVTVAVDGFKKKSIANTPTDIASFNDGTANPMPSLEISIKPVQSGSGDPSPSNVRPISGWSGANVTRCGINLFNKTTAIVGFIDDVTGERDPNPNYRSTDYIRVNGGESYYVKSEQTQGMWGAWYDEDMEYIARCAGYADKIITAPPNAAYARFTVVTTVSGNLDTFAVNYPATDTNYHAYNGSTTSIPFHDSSDNPITVYGGTLNVTSGELTATHANIASYNGETINEPWISSMDAYSAGATPTTGAQVVYPLATPITYQLTPTQVSTLLGQNNIFADCGQILEGEYFVTI